MSFEEQEGRREIPTDTTDGFISNITAEVSSRSKSLLGMYRLNFNLSRDISDSRILDVLQSGKYFLNNFQENGYGAIQTKNPDMGTGYAFASGQYFEKKGNIQGIKLFDQSLTIGRTNYIDEKGNQLLTPIYLVGAIQIDGIPMGGALNSDDVGCACKKLLGK